MERAFGADGKRVAKLTIREMEKADFERVVEITQRYFPKAGGRSLVRKRMGKGARYFVAEVEGHVVGFVDIEFGRNAKLYGLAVDKRVGSAGIGTRLVGRAVNEALRAGSRSVSLMVKEKNARAVSLYGRMGFETKSIRRGRSGAVLLMRKDFDS